MNHSVLQISNVRQNHAALASATEAPRSSNFTRTRAHASVDGSRHTLQDGEGVRYTKIATGPAPTFAYGPSQIPSNRGPIAPALAMLQGNCRNLLSSMSSSQNAASNRQGHSFLTHRGEPGLVKYQNDGAAAIYVNGKETFKCFIGSHYPGDTHIMMRGPGERMYAGRNLPQDYLQEGNALVNSAQRALSGLGDVQLQMRRWGH
jgi:hypothetical protein